MFAFAFGVAFGAALEPAVEALGADGTVRVLEGPLFAAPAAALVNLEAGGIPIISLGIL